MMDAIIASSFSFEVFLINKIISSSTCTWSREDINFSFDRDKFLDVSITTNFFSNSYYLV